MADRKEDTDVVQITFKRLGLITHDKEGQPDWDKPNLQVSVEDTKFIKFTVFSKDGDRTRASIAKFYTTSFTSMIDRIKDMLKKPEKGSVKVASRFSFKDKQTQETQWVDCNITIGRTQSGLCWVKVHRDTQTFGFKFLPISGMRYEENGKVIEESDVSPLIAVDWLETLRSSVVIADSFMEANTRVTWSKTGRF